MSALSLRLPRALHEQIKLLAEKEGMSINQFIASAAAEKLAALMTEDYIEKRARNASRKKFRAVLDKIPDVEAEDRDKI